MTNFSKPTAWKLMCLELCALSEALLGLLPVNNVPDRVKILTSIGKQIKRSETNEMRKRTSTLTFLYWR
jgi:hypothetical protein